MANWIRKIKLLPEWEQAQNDEIPIHKMAAVIAKRLKSLAPYGHDYLDQNLSELIETFEVLGEDQETEVTDFDFAMSELYDFGDCSLDGKWNGRKALWIDTTSA